MSHTNTAKLNLYKPNIDDKFGDSLVGFNDNSDILDNSVMSGISILNGNGITGGGDLSANRTLALTTLTSDWDIGVSRSIQTEKIIARSNLGLSLFEDGGVGLFVKDGGNVGHGTTDPGLAPDGVTYLGGRVFHFYNSASWSQMIIDGNHASFAMIDNAASANNKIISFQSNTGFFKIQILNDDLSSKHLSCFVIDTANGNVGLKTLTGSATLSINGGVHVGGNSDPGDNNIMVDGELHLDGALNHDGTTIGFYGTTPVTVGAGLTTQLTTITCSAPGTPDYAIADPVQAVGFGFSTSDEMLSALKVIANLQARVAELENRLGSSSGVGLFT